MPDLHISAIDPAVPASIIPNPDSALVGLVATNTNVSFTNINIVAGDNDFHVVNANSNASVTLENVTLDAVAGNDYMIRVGTSSEGLLNNVTVNGNEQLRRGVLVTKGSYLDVSNSTISGTLEQSAALLASGTLRVSGTSDFSSRITSSQSVVSLGTGSNITTRGVSLTAGSSMHMSTDSVLVSNGRIGVAEGSQFKARDVVINDDDLYVERGSSFRSRDTGASLVINNGRLRVRYGSNAQISEGQITSEPGSYALDVTNKSIVTMDSTVDESPFLFDGRATVENSSLETEEAIFLNTLELEFGATAILGSGSELLSGFDEQTGSAVYFD